MEAGLLWLLSTGSYCYMCTGNACRLIPRLSPILLVLTSINIKLEDEAFYTMQVCNKRYLGGVYHGVLYCRCPLSLG